MLFKQCFHIQKRFASIISTPNDPKLASLLSRLDKFDRKSKIFDKLDDLYLLTQRKGFFNLNANNLQFLSNSTKINNEFNNLYNFNNLNKIVANHYSNMVLLPAVTSGRNTTGSPLIVGNSPIQGLQILTGNRNGVLNNSAVGKYLSLLSKLAHNDTELKGKIEDVLKAFDKEDDFFFNYVLEFWISGKSFNKMKAKKLREQESENGGKGSLPSKMTI